MTLLGYLRNTNYHFAILLQNKGVKYTKTPNF